MAMMCDLLVAAENARFSYPEGKVGITGGMIAGLAARIPHKLAMEIMLLGEPIDAERAYEVGLANRIVPNGSEIDEAVAMAEKIVDLAPLALATMKRFVNDEVLPKGPAELAARFGAELAAVRNSADAAEGVRAFKEKRKPRYRGSLRRQAARRAADLSCDALLSDAMHLLAIAQPLLPPRRFAGSRHSCAARRGRPR